MQSIRDALRISLARSLDGLSPLDRLGAAWPLVAGHAVAERTSVTALEDGVATVTVPDLGWRNQLLSTADHLQSDLQRVSRVPLTDILFVLPSASAPAAEQQTQPTAAPRRGRKKP